MSKVNKSSNRWSVPSKIKKVKQPSHHIILNHLDLIAIEDGSTLADIAGRPKEEIAEVVATNEQMQTECQEQAEKNETQEAHGTNHHFVAYIINQNQQLIELDGQRKEGPKLI